MLQIVVNLPTVLCTPTAALALVDKSKELLAVQALGWCRLEHRLPLQKQRAAVICHYSVNVIKATIMNTLCRTAIEEPHPGSCVRDHL